MTSHRIGIVGLGKIAEDQHIPAIAANPAFTLLAVSSRRGLSVPGVPFACKTHGEMFETVPDIDTVAICTPPQVHYAIARDALAAGKHVLLEKPPTATLTELADLERLAQIAGKTLFTTWHSQYNRAVDEAKAALSGRSVSRLLVTWKEDVRQWHPGQEWIWEAGGFGVFDPGVNALSILTKIFPEPIFVRRADLQFPANRDAPIAAALEFGSGQPDASLRAEFDWRHTGTQTWDVEIETSDGLRLSLTGGGHRLVIDGRTVVDEKPAEYPGIYERFAALLAGGASLVDDKPARLVADAFTVGRRMTVEAFTP